MVITKEDFERYLVVQRSGVVNMMYRHDVERLSGLTSAQQRAIHEQYAELQVRWPMTPQIEAEAEELRAEYAQDK